MTEIQNPNPVPKVRHKQVLVIGNWNLFAIWIL